MDRQIIYPAAIPLESDLLNTNKYAMIGLAKLSAAIMGTNTYLRGLECKVSSPVSMTVNVSAGEIYSLQNVDGTAYSSLDADTTNTILKQGIVLSATSFTLTAPTTSGQSVNYLVQVAYSDVDSGATVLPYYNAANPSVAYSGPNNSGAAQNTVRSGVCTVALKAGVAATTGTQTTPSADTGYIAAWVITVAQGATSVTAANIAQAIGAPFIPTSGIVDGIQKKLLTHGTDIGSVNAYAVNYSPAITTLTDGMELTFKATSTNTAAATFSQNALTAYPVVKVGGSVLTGGEIVSGGYATVKWNAVLSAWALVQSTGSGAALSNLGLTDAVHLASMTATSSGSGYEQRPVLVGGVQKTLVRQWGFALTSSISTGQTSSWSSSLPLAISTLLTSNATPANGAISNGVCITVNDIGTPYTGTVNNLPLTSVNSISGSFLNNSGSTTKIGIRWECTGYL